MASNLGDDLLCAICQDHFILPKVLPCGHTYCKGCLEQWVGANKHFLRLQPRFPCPACRKETILPRGGVDELATNFVIKKLQDRFVKKQECLTLGSMDGSLHGSCGHSEHKTLYCQQCLETMCPDCINGHTGHACMSLKKAIENYKIELKNLSNQLRERVTSLHDRYSNCLQSYEISITETKRAISQRADDIKRNIDTIAQDLIREVECLKFRHIDEMIKQREDLHEYLMLLDGYMQDKISEDNVSENKEPNDSFTKHTVTELDDVSLKLGHLKQLLAEVSSLRRPEAKVKVEFVSGKNESNKSIGKLFGKTSVSFLNTSGSVSEDFETQTVLHVRTVTLKRDANRSFGVTVAAASDGTRPMKVVKVNAHAREQGLNLKDEIMLLNGVRTEGMMQQQTYDMTNSADDLVLVVLSHCSSTEQIGHASKKWDRLRCLFTRSRSQ